MSGHQEYKCPKCGFEWETLESNAKCPRCDFTDQGGFEYLRAMIEASPKEWLPGLTGIVIGACIKSGVYKLGHAWESVKTTESIWKRERNAFPEVNKPTPNPLLPGLHEAMRLMKLEETNDLGVCRVVAKIEELEGSHAS